MLTSSSRLTRAKSLLRAVREHYVRDDLPCGLPGCDLCGGDLSRSADPVVVAVPDSGCLEAQIDAISSAGWQKLCFTVILGTAETTLRKVDFVKHRRIVSLMAERENDSSRVKNVEENGTDVRDRSARFSVFADQHARETFCEKLPGESSREYERRCIVGSCVWLRSHADKHAPHCRVVLVSDDKARMLLPAERFGLEALSTVEFVEKFVAPSAPEVVDIVASVSADSKSKLRSTATGKSGGTDGQLFAEHLSAAAIEAGVREGRLFQGPIHMHSRHCFEGYVPSDTLDVGADMAKEIAIRGTEYLNRAVNGDIVAVELLPREEWSAERDAFIISGTESEDALTEATKAPPTSASSRTTASTNGRPVKPAGRVVGIVKRNWTPYPGSIAPPEQGAVVGSGTEGQSVLFVPVDPSLPKIRMRTRQASLLLDQRIVVCIDSWDRNSRYPHGHLVRIIGARGDKDVETEVLLLQHDIPFHDFSDSVMACLPPRDWTVATHATPHDFASRQDLRDRCVVSVDPPGCTDIDDALHCKFLDDGLVEIGVHIADVSHFIRAGTALDLEAADRGTTVYLVNRRIDMVPKLLGENVCSLVGGGERFAFSVMWIVDPKTAEVKRVDYCKSIIRSHGAFSYGEAQARIDDRQQNDQITQSLRTLLGISKILKQKRVDAGALTLASAEVRFIHENDNRNLDPVQLELYQTKATNSMVEEFMLLANVWVGQRIVDAFPHCAMLRRHPPPETATFGPLLESLKQRGVTLDTSTSKSLAESLDAAKLPRATGKEAQSFSTLIRTLTTRCMQQAVYFSSGSQPRDQYRHYGLAAEVYTHFTSPIRRYADVIVHRLLAAAIGADTAKPETLQSEHTQRIAQHINKRNRMAQYAARVSTELHTWLFFKGIMDRAAKQKKRTYMVEGSEVTDAAAVAEGYVTKVRANAFMATVPAYGIEGIIFLSGANEPVPPGWEFDELEQFLRRPDGGSLRVFDRVRVAVLPDDARQSIRLLSIDPPLHSVRAPAANVPATLTAADSADALVPRTTADPASKKAPASEALRPPKAQRPAKRSRKSRS